MNVDGLTNGIVIDHIKAGMSMRIYNLLGLAELDCCVAILKNVASNKYGKKDIIKIDGYIDLDLDMLGYVDPNITVNHIKDGVIIKKEHMTLPKELKNVLTCNNPRCITSIEQEIDNVFRLVDADRRLYRCVYCETAAR